MDYSRQSLALAGSNAIFARCIVSTFFRVVDSMGDCVVLLCVDMEDEKNTKRFQKYTLFVVPKVYGFFDTKACVIFGTFPGYSKSMFFNRRDSAKIRLKKRALF